MIARHGCQNGIIHYSLQQGDNGEHPRDPIHDHPICYINILQQCRNRSKLILLFLFSDKPKVTVTRQVSDVVEEGKGSITMTCSADANPPARIFWRKYDGTDESQFVETLSFNPVIFLFLQDCQTSFQL